MEQQTDIFNNGSVWVRADFHLHTSADKEFSIVVQKAILLGSTLSN